MNTKLERFNQLKAAMIVLGLSLELYAAVQFISTPEQASADEVSAVFNRDLATLQAAQSKE